MKLNSIFKNSLYKYIFIIEMVAPWIVAILGGIATYFFNSSYRYLRQDLVGRYELYNSIFDVFYISALGYATILIAALIILGFVFLVISLRNAFSKDIERKANLEGSLIIWICSGGCILGTILFILLTAGLTYGQSV